MKLQQFYLKVEKCLQYPRRAYNRWVLFGIAVLLSFPSVSKADAEERDALNATNVITENYEKKKELPCDTTWDSPSTAQVQSRKATWNDIFIASTTRRSMDSNTNLVSPEKDRRCSDKSSCDVDSINETDVVTHPKCDEASGCNVPLHCFDFKSVPAYAFVIPDPPQVMRVSPHRLEAIVEDAAIQNCCAVVLFYAPWCTFSVQFARKFNALGKSFENLPILAVDLAENDP